MLTSKKVRGRSKRKRGFMFKNTLLGNQIASSQRSKMIIRNRLNSGWFKLRFHVTLSSTLLGVMQSNFSTSSPRRAINGAGTYINFDEIAQLYDMYRVTSVSIKFIPQLPNDSSTQTGYFPLYFVYDKNSGDGSPLTSVDNALQYDNVKIRNVFRPFRIKYRVPPGIIGTGTAAVLHGGRLYFSTEVDPNIGTIKMYGDGFDVSQAYGELILQMVIECKNRN